MAMRVRVNCELDDIWELSFLARRFACGLVPLPNQGACQSEKTAGNCQESGLLVEIPTQELAANPKLQLGTFATRGASTPHAIEKELK